MRSPTWADRLGRPAAALLGAALLAGCGGHAAPPSSTATDSGLPAQLVAQARPIGRGPEFHPGVTGPVFGACLANLGRRVGVHVELFGANRVVLVGQGIGTMAPRRVFAGRITSARCYGALVTLDPTGVVYMRPGTRAVLADLFRSWGQPLSPRRMAGFAGPVSVFVNGARRLGDPRRLPLRPHDEIVLEVGPHVPPHHGYTFPPNS
jgi:hypothetical protein